MTEVKMAKQLKLEWAVGVALDPSHNNDPIFVGRGTNTDPDGNLVDGGFSFDVMFSTKHPLSQKLKELEEQGKGIKLVVVPCKDEETSKKTAQNLIKEYGLVKDGGTLLNWSEDGEAEGQTYSGSPSKRLH